MTFSQNLSGAICLFAKTPRLGGVKTRLEPHLGRENCLRLHKWLVEDRLRMLAVTHHASADIETLLYVTDPLDDDYWKKIFSEYQMRLRLQVGDTLGDRMYQAVESALKEKDWVILIGADCPDLNDDYIQEAISSIEAGHQAVIGPAEDGGYVLLALTQPFAEIFQEIDWGTDRVLSQTLDAIKALEVDCKQLKPLKDLDVYDDYLYYQNKVENSFSR